MIALTSPPPFGPAIAAFMEGARRGVEAAIAKQAEGE